ncbi:hypothetical protein DPMN_045552 [Dreissena polymorpha]|uniref:Uncharacterized protein n=1 Tax=Dreissena polymorpha TaxID=45954 RepID=A0A9D4HZR1_DREPO|nr:hypothetical protein DPMN_045552 [Dreissena polymorpha]
MTMSCALNLKIKVLSPAVNEANDFALKNLHTSFKPVFADPEKNLQEYYVHTHWHPSQVLGEHEKDEVLVRKHLLPVKNRANERENEPSDQERHQLKVNCTVNIYVKLLP